MALEAFGVALLKVNMNFAKKKPQNKTVELMSQFGGKADRIAIV